MILVINNQLTLLINTHGLFAINHLLTLFTYTELPFMKTPRTYIQNSSSVLILAFSTSALAHNGEHAAASTMSSIASQVTHLVSEANHMASIAILAVVGLVLAKVSTKIFTKARAKAFRKTIQKKSRAQTHPHPPIRFNQ